MFDLPEETDVGYVQLKEPDKFPSDFNVLERFMCTQP